MQLKHKLRIFNITTLAKYVLAEIQEIILHIIFLVKKIRIPRIGCVACLNANHLIWKREKTLLLIIAAIPKSNPSLQTSNEINASLQKLLMGNNIFTLYFTPTTQTKSKKAITWPKFCGWLPISKLTCILQWYILLQTFNKINASLQKLLSGNQ